MFGIILPVGSNEYTGVSLQTIYQTVQEFVVNHAAFMVPFLGPGIRKEDIDNIETVARYLKC